MSDDAYEIRQKADETCRGSMQHLVTVDFTPLRMNQPLSSDVDYSFSLRSITD